MSQHLRLIGLNETIVKNAALEVLFPADRLFRALDYLRRTLPPTYVKSFHPDYIPNVKHLFERLCFYKISVQYIVAMFNEIRGEGNDHCPNLVTAAISIVTAAGATLGGVTPPTDEEMSAYAYFQDQEKFNSLIVHVQCFPNAIPTFLNKLGYEVDICYRAEKDKETFVDKVREWFARGGSLYQVWAVLLEMELKATASRVGLPRAPKEYTPAKYMYEPAEQKDHSSNALDIDEPKTTPPQPTTMSGFSSNPFAKLAKTQKELVLSELKGVFFDNLICQLTIYGAWPAWLDAQGLSGNPEIDEFVAGMMDTSNSDPTANVAKKLFAAIAASPAYADMTEKKFLASFDDIKEPHVQEALVAWRAMLAAKKSNDGAGDAGLKQKVREFLVSASVCGPQENAALLTMSNQIVSELQLKNFEDLRLYTNPDDWAFLGLKAHVRVRLLAAVKEVKPSASTQQ